MDLLELKAKKSIFTAHNDEDNLETEMFYEQFYIFGSQIHTKINEYRALAKTLYKL